MRSIALIGPQGSGKTTVARALAAHGYQHLSFAGLLRAIATLAYGPVDKAATYTVRRGGADVALTGRRLLQELGTDTIRQTMDEDFWLRALLRRLRPGRAYVVDDCRFPNEETALRDRGFLFVRLHGRAAPDQADHESERHWPTFTYDASVDSVYGTPAEVARRVAVLASYLDEEDSDG